MLVDTHAHLDFTDDIDGWCQRARADGVEKIICVGTSVEANKKCAEIAQKYTDDDLQIYSSVGIHAQDGKDDVEKYGSLNKCIEQLREVAKFEKVVAVGECGFDFYLPGEKRIPTVDKDKQFQKELFEAQIQLAGELKLPLIVHCRNAWKETFSLLTTDYRLLPAVGVFHSWTGDWQAAQKVLALGFYISFSGIVTFGNAASVQEVALKMPLERMLLETDSPFLAPEPIRGSKNEPKNVKIVDKFIADLRHQSFELISDATSANATKLFSLYQQVTSAKS